ncbi:unnamed protein product [Paramecium primaurelia]|uniref:CCAAT-binding factor domain-containing protein n=1 Tax=Paramecium primaurelia TaxID=5886 RepID=A0A8S1LY37_PARPR|nr:unnamed protein product [Paramecium primaurelia]
MVILKLASEIIEDGNLNKLNSLLSMPLTQELVQTLRRIFLYLQDKKLFVISYGSEWNQWNIKKNNNNRQNESNQIDNFLNVKWSVFLRLLFQHSFYNDLLLSIEQTINCPPYVRLVETSVEKGFEIPIHSNYFEVLQYLTFDFEKFIILLKRFPEIEQKDKAQFTIFVQKQLSKITNNQERLSFSKLINTHLVDKVDNPLILADFLQHSIDNGSLELKINSLQSLLILITRFNYNLENFYERLIQIIDTEGAFECSSKSKLFKLIDVATKSSKVPLQTLARIIQSILRAFLKESCSLQLAATQLIFNIFKKHVTLKQFLQQGDTQLVELASYQNHWHPEIKRIISYLEDDLSIFDYFNLNDVIELQDQQLLEAQF